MIDDRTEETSGLSRHGPVIHPRDLGSGALTVPEYPVIYEFDSGRNALEPARGAVYGAGFSDEEFDYFGIILLICYAELLRELIGTALANAPNDGDGVIESAFSSTVSSAGNEPVHSTHAAAKALVAIGTGLLVFAALAQIAC